MAYKLFQDTLAASISGGTGEAIYTGWGLILVAFERAEETMDRLEEISFLPTLLARAKKSA